MAVSKDQQLEWRVVAVLSGTLAAMAVRRLLVAAWRATGRTAEDAEAGSWPQAMAWGAALGAGIGAARVAAHRLAAVGFERITGNQPLDPISK